MAKYNFGNIDVDMVDYQFNPSHYYYTPDGTKVEPVDGIPKESVCFHNVNEDDPVHPSGTMSTTTFDHDTLDIYFIAGWPCENIGSHWNHLDLKPYIKYREALAPR